MKSDEGSRTACAPATQACPMLTCIFGTAEPEYFIKREGGSQPERTQNLELCYF